MPDTPPAPVPVPDALTINVRLQKRMEDLNKRLGILMAAANALPEMYRPAAINEFNRLLKEHIASLSLSFVILGIVPDTSDGQNAEDPDALTKALKARGFAVGEAPPVPPAATAASTESPLLTPDIGLAGHPAFALAIERGFDPNADTD